MKLWWTDCSSNIPTASPATTATVLDSDLLWSPRVGLKSVLPRAEHCTQFHSCVRSGIRRANGRNQHTWICGCLCGWLTFWRNEQHWLTVTLARLNRNLETVVCQYYCHFVMSSASGVFICFCVTLGTFVVTFADGWHFDTMSNTGLQLVCAIVMITCLHLLLGHPGQAVCYVR